MACLQHVGPETLATLSALFLFLSGSLTSVKQTMPEGFTLRHSHDRPV